MFKKKLFSSFRQNINLFIADLLSMGYVCPMGDVHKEHVQYDLLQSRLLAYIFSVNINLCSISKHFLLYGHKVFILFSFQIRKLKYVSRFRKKKKLHWILFQFFNEFRRVIKTYFLILEKHPVYRMVLKNFGLVNCMKRMYSYYS